ncbi:MAG TPA: sugar ABC transporter substrate-binding protein [candidate division Zixibacteria bacterium]|nr:sugar ABC transporter substrate-binding protein [candidate division Zixibacteria bacterium]
MLERIGRYALWIGVFATVGWWLFSDTYAKYAVSNAASDLRVAFWGDYREFIMWQEILTDFERLHPEISVHIEYITDRYDQKIRQLFVADAAPDVMLLQDEPFPRYMDSDKLEDLTPYLKTSSATIVDTSYWDTAWRSFGRYEETSDGSTPWRQYGIPTWGGCNLLFYNKSCFDRANVALPDDRTWTIDDFRTLCRQLTRDFDGDGRIDQFAFQVPNMTYWLPWHWGLGARVLDEERRLFALTGPEAEVSFQLMQDLMYRDRVAPNAGELTIGQNVAFFTGRLALFSSGPWAMPFLNTTDMDYGVLHIPSGPGGRASRITWDAVTMFKGSKNKKMAWQLIQHITDLKSQETVARFQRSVPALKAAQTAFEGENPRVQVRKFIEAVDQYARLQPISPHWELMMRAITKNVDLLLHPDPTLRITPQNAIGLILQEPNLLDNLPPADRNLADAYLLKLYASPEMRERGQ